MKRILFWTSGMGTGHIKHANALWRGLVQTGEPVEYFVSADRSIFRDKLDPRILLWPGGSEPVDAVVLDHWLEYLTPEHRELSSLFIQMRRIGSSDEFPEISSGRVARISIEDGELCRRENLPYDGCLVDADHSEIYETSDARERLQTAAGRELQGRLGLAHVNTARPGAALAFFRKAVDALYGKADTIVLSTAHRNIVEEVEEMTRTLFPGRAAVFELYPAYRYYPAFDVGFLPCGYNTYCEAQLFFKGECRFEPSTIFDGRLLFKDQVLRVAEMPEVGAIGNRNIARRILDLC